MKMIRSSLPTKICLWLHYFSQGRVRRAGILGKNPALGTASWPPGTSLVRLSITCWKGFIPLSLKRGAIAHEAY